MARIPVEKRDAGFPWWGWILALVIAVGAIWLIAELLDNDAEVEPIETAAVYEMDRNALDDPAITSYTMVVDPMNMQSLSGKKVDLQNMKVTSVIGDQAFYVESADQAGEDILIVLDEVPTPGTQTEGRYDVTAGQELAIQGRIHRLDANIMNELGITDQEAKRAKDDALYIRAQSLNIRS